MGLKRSIVLVGSVLVLAACDRVSAPTGPLSLHDGPAASAKRSDTTRSTSTTFSTLTAEGSGCGFVKSGDSDSTMVCETY